jgi:hypothetical protein
MKKILFGLIATIFFGFLGNSQTFEDFDNYGKLHNEYVTLFLNSGKKVSDYKNLNDFANDYYDVVAKKYPLIEKNKFLTELNNVFLKEFYANNNNATTLKNLIKKMNDEKKISKPVYDKLSLIIDSQDDYPKINELTEEILSLNLTDFERNSMRVFKSTLENSNTLWTNYSSKLKKGSMTIIGDCIGAFVFCYIPPLAALAGGSISLMVHNSDNP